MDFDYIIAGAGFSGSVIARKLAEDGKKVLILERRNHIGGNMYDEVDSNGILIQKYGPHIFHTQSDVVNDFVTKYGLWEPFKLRCMVEMGDTLVPSPFNFTAIDMLYDEENAEKLKKALTAEYPGKTIITIDELMQSENELIIAYSKLLFDLDYKPYTAKQWGVEPDKVDISILRRVPVRLDTVDAYFNDKFEYLPEKGFTSFFSNLLSHENIEVHLNTDILEYLSFSENHIKYKDSQEYNIIFTGPPDEIFHYEYGRLPYRSLRFDYQTKYIDSFQPTPVVAYPLAEGYTRITEYKKLPIQNLGNVTTIALEYPVAFDEKTSSELEPYYPIINEENRQAYNRYKEKSSQYANLFLCGRLAEYQYYNMDQAILNALRKYEIIKEKTYENN